MLLKFYNPYKTSHGYEEVTTQGIAQRSRNEEQDHHRSGMSEMYYYNAPGLLNDNIKSDSGALLAANGTPVRYSGITFASQYDDLVNRLILDAPDGYSVVTVPQPRYIHVFVSGKLEVKVGGTTLAITNFDLERTMNPYHAVGDKVYVLWSDLFTKSGVVPWEGYKETQITRIIKQGFMVPIGYKRRPKVSDPVRRMGVSLAFSFTFNKCQGMTMERAILSLDDAVGSCKTFLELAHLYVALSRVIKGCYLAKLQGNNFEYLTKMKYPPCIMQWKNSYDADGNWVDGMIGVEAIVNAFEGYGSLHAMSFADKRRIAKLMGEVVHKKSNDELHNLLAPWFRYAKENHQSESVADLQGTN